MGKYIVSGSGYSLTFSLASNRDLAHGYGGYGLLRPQGPYIYVSIWLEWVILIEYLGRPEDWAFYEGESFYFCLGGLELNFTGCTLEQIYVCMAMREERTLAAWWRLMPNCLGIDTLYIGREWLQLLMQIFAPCPTRSNLDFCGWHGPVQVCQEHLRNIELMAEATGAMLGKGSGMPTEEFT